MLLKGHNNLDAKVFKNCTRYNFFLQSIVHPYHRSLLEALSEMRRRRDVRPNDHFLEQVFFVQSNGFKSKFLPVSRPRQQPAER